MKRRLFVTTALPYANGSFHIGHIMEYIQADIWVRFQRMRGHEVHFVCADDGHGAPIMLKAQAEGITPEQLVARIAAERPQYLNGFHISFDNWHSTHSDENTELSQSIYQALKANELISTRVIEQYRTWTTLPTDGSPSYPPSDMGGTKVDWNGNPRQREIAQQTIQLEYTWDRTTSASTTATDPSFASFVAAQGKRNTDTIFGFVKGSLLYRGCQATLEEERWRLVHVWVFDDIYHLVQLPLPNATGAPILLPGITVAGQQILQADKVGWFQPYTDFVNWSTLLPTEVYNELPKARPARI
mgnify:CR=1 FL=1